MQIFLSAETLLNLYKLLQCMDDRLELWSYTSTRDCQGSWLWVIFMCSLSDKRANCLSASCVKIPKGTRLYLLESSHKLALFFKPRSWVPRFNNLGYWSVGWTKSLDFFQDDDEILICVYNLFVKFSFQLVKKQIKK